ncbi:MAG TPA: serine/threonine-protein kinase [Anaerolineae bacterium]|nr:serine/threonine-protein kinase [Anaerolineae bacterium]
MEHYRDKVLEGRYRLTHRIGQGGMATVYLAYNERLGKDVVIKQNGNSRWPEDQLLFEQEAQILAQLDMPGRSVGLPRVLDYFVDFDQGDSVQYLVMDYIEGEDLESIVARAGHLDEQTALFWMDQVLAAVEFLHQQTPPIIHRDIKPGNIRVTGQGENVYLVDFGIAGANASQRGTDGYAPPEQYQGLTKDVRSDIYALGATLYAILTGEIPPQSLRLQGKAQKLISPSKFKHVAISSPLEAVILKAMHLDPQNRYATTTEMRKALQALQTTKPPVLPAKLRPQLKPPEELDPPPQISPQVTAKWWVKPNAMMMRLALNPQGNCIMSGGDDCTVNFWSVTQWNIPGRLFGSGYHQDWVYGVAFSKDGRWAASCGRDRTIQLWDAHTAQPWGGPLRGHSGRVSSVAFSPDGQMLASAAEDRTVRLWPLAAGGGASILARDVSVNVLAFSPDGRWLAAACNDHRLHVWDWAKGDEIALPADIAQHNGPVFTVAFDPHGEWLASGGDDQFVHLFRLRGAGAGQRLDPQNWQRQYVMGKSPGNIHSMAFSPDGQLLASAGADGMLSLWDTRHLYLIGNYRLGDVSLLSVAFGRDRYTLALSGKGVIMLIKLI